MREVPGTLKEIFLKHGSVPFLETLFFCLVIYFKRTVRIGKLSTRRQESSIGPKTKTGKLHCNIL